jgi:hypothetical protein
MTSEFVGINNEDTTVLMMSEGNVARSDVFPDSFVWQTGMETILTNRDNGVSVPHVFVREVCGFGYILVQNRAGLEGEQSISCLFAKAKILFEWIRLHL